MELLTTTPVLLAELTVISLFFSLCYTALYCWWKSVSKKKTPYVNDKSEVDNLSDPKWDCEAVN